MRRATAVAALGWALFNAAAPGAAGAGAAEGVIEGGFSSDGKYELRVVPPPSPGTPHFVQLVDSHSGEEADRIALIQPRLPDPDAPPCQAVWQPGGTSFAFLDHDHKYSTHLLLYTVSGGHLVSLPVPDYVQNALGRVNATEATLPCWSRVGLWNGDELPVILIFNAPDTSGKWVMHNAVVTLRLVSKEGKLPEVKLEQVKIIEKPAH